VYEKAAAYKIFLSSY